MIQETRFSDATAKINHLVDHPEEFLVYDGSKGFTLGPTASRAGMKLTDMMNLHFPEAVYALHRDYRNAGSQLIQTNTFNANSARFDSEGVKANIFEINKQGSRIARSAVGDKTLVVGSMGPTGKIVSDKLAHINFNNAIPVEEAIEIYKEQVLGLKEGGVDIFGPETHDNPAELLAAIEAIRRVAPDAPIIATATFDKKIQQGRSVFTTNYGLIPQKLITISDEKGLIAIGANCGFGTRGARLLVKELAKGTDTVIVAKLNKGKPSLLNGINVYPSVDMGEYGLRMYDYGARIIGACCGSTPNDIERIANSLANLTEV